MKEATQQNKMKIPCKVFQVYEAALGCFDICVFEYILDMSVCVCVSVFLLSKNTQLLLKAEPAQISSVEN